MTRTAYLLGALAAALLLAGCVSAEAKARRARNADYAAARSANTVEAWLAYANEHPDDRNAARARRKAGDLVYAAAVERNTPGAFEGYLRQFPHGGQVKEARAARATLRFAEAQREDSVEAYRRFAKEHPESDQAGKALGIANLRSLYADLKSARTFDIEIAVRGPRDFEKAEDLRRYLEGPIELTLRQAGLARVETGSADITVRIGGRMTWYARTYQVSLLQYRLDNAGALFQGTTTIRSANGRYDWDYYGESRPPSQVRLRKRQGRLELDGEEADRTAIRYASTDHAVVRIVARVFGPEVLVQLYHQERRLQPACSSAALELEREGVETVLRMLRSHGRREEREAAGALLQVLASGRYRMLNGVEVRRKN